MVGALLEEDTVAEVNPKSRGLRIVAVAVCLAAGLISWPLGVLASMIYHLGEGGRLEIAGGALGAVGGLLAGLLWVNRMIAETRKRLPGRARLSRALIALGVPWGVLCGLGATVVLHGGLMVVRGGLRFDALLVGSLFALPTGLVLGLIGGLAWWMVACRQHVAPPPEPASQPNVP
jgi:hypothetical protein